VVARVGGQPITADDVARIAGAQQIDPARARAIAVHDTLLARGAEARGLAASADARLAREGDLARRLLRHVLAEARTVALTEPEIQEASRRRWLEIDRPEGFRTVHAVVRLAASDDEGKKVRARVLAEAIHAAVLSVAERAPSLPLPEGGPLPAARIAAQSDPDPLSRAFRLAAQAAPVPEGLQVVVEPLPAVSAEGRLLTLGDESRLDPAYARAASALPARGALSPVVESSFGLHVILLLERTPALVLQGEARAARLRDDIVNERARAAEKRILAGQQARRSVEPDAAALLDLVRVDP
jgi:peptidyl-prolyl cis-trans isomerase C